MNKQHEWRCICEECLAPHRENGCSYGTPDGPDDNNYDCDCEAQ